MPEKDCHTLIAFASEVNTEIVLTQEHPHTHPPHCTSKDVYRSMENTLKK